jgi:dTMP kinase
MPCERREHVRETIEPALAAGTTILCDRYYLSSVAYQGARGLDANAILRANEEAFPQPDLALIFEIEAEEGLSRVAARGGVAEPAFEEVGFLREVAKVFAAIDRP